MTSVSQPFIADLAPARSSNRPDAPAREARRDDEKFSVSEPPQSIGQRKDIPDAPVAPITPVHARTPRHDDRSSETPNTTASVPTPASETGTRDPVQSFDAVIPPVNLSEPATGLIAGVAGTAAASNLTGQIAAVAPENGGAQNGSAIAAATIPAGQPHPAQVNLTTADATTNAFSTSDGASPQTATPGTNGQTADPAATAVSSAGVAGTQLSQTAQQIAAAANVSRPGSNGAPANSAAPSSPKTAAGKNTLLDQQSGDIEPSGNDGKKPAAAFATGAGATLSADITVKPPQTQASSQIMAQAMANAPAIAVATPESTPPSLTALALPSVTGDALGVTQSFNAEMRAAIDAPTQAAAYTARGAVTAQPAVEQIAMQITRAADQNIDRMTVHLKPAELGKVTIDLEVGPDNRLLAVISAERSETLDLLQRDAKSLEKALNEAGVKTDSGSLEFNLKGEGGSAENGRDGDGKLHDGAVMLPGDIDAADINDIPKNTPLILPEGRIDIQV